MPRIERVRGDLPQGLAERFRAVPLVAWDTETSGLDWRVERLALCQLSSPEIGTVLVQLEEERPERLIDLLVEPSLTKLFHHAPFDLAFMRSAWGARAENVRCTKVASKLTHPEAPPTEHSLQRLVQTRLGITLTKGSVRTSNWAADDLSDEQVRYASADVEHLPALYEALNSEIDRAGVRELYEATCDFLPYAAELEVLQIPDPFRY